MALAGNIGGERVVTILIASAIAMALISILISVLEAAYTDIHIGMKEVTTHCIITTLIVVIYELVRQGLMRIG